MVMRINIETEAHLLAPPLLVLMPYCPAQQNVKPVLLYSSCSIQNTSYAQIIMQWLLLPATGAWKKEMFCLDPTVLCPTV